MLGHIGRERWVRQIYQESAKMMIKGNIKWISIIIWILNAIILLKQKGTLNNTSGLKGSLEIHGVWLFLISNEETEDLEGRKKPSESKHCLPSRPCAGEVFLQLLTNAYNGCNVPYRLLSLKIKGSEASVNWVCLCNKVLTIMLFRGIF